MFYCNSRCVSHDQLKRDIYVKEHRYACKNWSTDPDFSRHGFSFSKHVRASRHVFRLWDSLLQSVSLRVYIDIATVCVGFSSLRDHSSVCVTLLCLLLISVCLFNSQLNGRRRQRSRRLTVNLVNHPVIQAKPEKYVIDCHLSVNKISSYSSNQGGS